jgi:hypothetical protein
MNDSEISLIGDLEHIPGDEALLVEKDEDYVRACSMLAGAMRSNSESAPAVWVRSRNHFSWLKNFVEQIEFPAKFTIKTPRNILADRWNVDIPAWLDDQSVIENDLLRLEVDAAKRVSFETRLLTVLLGINFQPDRLEGPEVISIINLLVRQQALEKFKDYPALSKCLEIKCRTWANNTDEDWVKQICLLLPGQSKDLWQWLSLWSGLHGYPEKLLGYVLSPEQALLVRNIPPEALKDLPVEHSAREKILTQIELFFNDVAAQINSQEEFHKVLGMTSGRFFKEFQYISGILKENRFDPAIDDIHRVKQKFKSCPGISTHQLRTLNQYIKPDRPSLPSQEEFRSWSSQDWIRWTVNEYTPFRLWQEHQGKFDEKLENIVAGFSEWYVEKYISIHQDPGQSLAHSLSFLAKRQHGRFLDVVLLVDCLPSAYMRIIDEAFLEAGFNRFDLHYRFAALPTTTRHNKPVLLKGQWLEKPPAYESIIQERALNDWQGRQAFYVHNLRDLMDTVPPEEGGIIVMNMVETDRIFHEDLEARVTTYEEELSRAFSRLADSVNSMALKWTGALDKINVCIVTDHGACRILEEETRKFDSKVVNRLFPNEKYRFSEISSDKTGDIPNNIWQLGHKFKNPFVSDSATFFLPSGHNTVRGTGKTKGYMHGGATPEEVIVPVAHYRLVKVGWKAPAVRFLNLDLVPGTGRAKFNIQRLIQLELEIQNPNPTDIEVVRAGILSPETDLRSFDRVVVPSRGDNTLLMGCYFERQALGEKTLVIELTYEISGEQQTMTLNLECDFRSAMKSGFSLKDL